MAKEEIDILEEVTSSEYKYGFHDNFEADEFPAGLNESVVRQLSAKKNEPEWMLEYRLSAYNTWLSMKEPKWSNVHYTPVDYQAIKYYSAPKVAKVVESMDDVDPELRATFEKLGISLKEQKRLLNVKDGEELSGIRLIWQKEVSFFVQFQRLFKNIQN